MNRKTEWVSSNRKENAILIGAGAALLVVPTALNEVFGEPYGDWWAPLPIWRFWFPDNDLGFVASLFFPAAGFSFFTSTCLLATRKIGSLISGLFLAGAFLIQSLWSFYGWEGGLQYQGFGHTLCVIILGFCLLVAALICLLISWKSKTNRSLLSSFWFLFLWFAWVAVPWLGESI